MRGFADFDDDDEDDLDEEEDDLVEDDLDDDERDDMLGPLWKLFTRLSSEEQANRINYDCTALAYALRGIGSKGPCATEAEKGGRGQRSDTWVMIA